MKTKTMVNSSNRSASFAFNQAVSKANTPMTTTWNGAVTPATTGDKVLDMFAKLSSARNESDSTIISMFLAAYNENPLYAMKVLFNSRDIREGAGTRKPFHVILNAMAHANKETQAIVIKNLHLIPEFGYWKDLYCLWETPLQANAVAFWCTQLQADFRALNEGRVNDITLAAKYCPSEREGQETYINPFLEYVNSIFHWTPRIYRKNVSALRKHLGIVERAMSQQAWSEINFSHVPSVAMKNYYKAFYKHQQERFDAFIKRVNKGEEKINSSVLYPGELVAAYKAGDMRKTNEVLEAQWLNLKKTMPELTKPLLPVLDVSASMDTRNHPTCREIGEGLTIYCCESNGGILSLFSGKAELLEMKGKTLRERIQFIAKYSIVANTNVQALFDLLLEFALKNKLTNEQLPDLLLISDMQFDPSVARGNGMQDTAFNVAKTKFERAGYSLPKVIYWNVNAAPGQPVTKNETNTVLVSGYSPNMLKYVLANKALPTPYEIMLDVINAPRYACVTI